MGPVSVIAPQLMQLWGQPGVCQDPLGGQMPHHCLARVPPGSRLGSAPLGSQAPRRALQGQRPHRVSWGDPQQAPLSAPTRGAGVVPGAGGSPWDRGGRSHRQEKQRNKSRVALDTGPGAGWVPSAARGDGEGREGAASAPRRLFGR